MTTIAPTYYVRHPDGSYSKADPQPAMVVYGSPAPRPPCAVCGVPYMKHGTAPTCASHDYTDAVPGFRSVGKADFHMSAEMDVRIGTDLYIRTDGVGLGDTAQLKGGA